MGLKCFFSLPPDGLERSTEAHIKPYVTASHSLVALSHLEIMIMSSFKRKGSSKSAQTLPGTRPSPTSPSTTITSVGIPSLDDILGGGLPLSCSLLTLAPDPHTSYGELVQKYFVAQGLASGQTVLIVDDNPDDFVRDVMWIPPSGEEDKEDGELDQSIKIAWRYADMKQFQTTVTYVHLP